MALRGIYLLVLDTLSPKVRNTVDGIVTCSMVNVGANNNFEVRKLLCVF